MISSEINWVIHVNSACFANGSMSTDTTKGFYKWDSAGPAMNFLLVVHTLCYVRCMHTHRNWSIIIIQYNTIHKDMMHWVWHKPRPVRGCSTVQICQLVTTNLSGSHTMYVIDDWRNRNTINNCLSPTSLDAVEHGTFPNKVTFAPWRDHRLTIEHLKGFNR